MMANSIHKAVNRFSEIDWILDRKYLIHKINELSWRGVDVTDHRNNFAVYNIPAEKQWCVEYITPSAGMQVSTIVIFNSDIKPIRVATQQAVYTAERYLKRYQSLITLIETVKSLNAQQ